MKKIVSAILVAMTCALSGCMAEPVDSAEIDSAAIESELSTEASLEASAVSLEDDDAMVEETNSSYYYCQGLLATYYWTIRPLCTTQPMINCAIERLADRSSPCQLAMCSNQIHQCSPGGW